MTTLPEFLLARIAEDEAVAREAEAAYTSSHETGNPQTWIYHDYDCATWAPAVGMGYERLLAECEAKRRIVEFHAELAYDETEYSGWVNLALDTLLSLALPYADHPDYQESGRP